MMGYLILQNNQPVVVYKDYARAVRFLRRSVWAEGRVMLPITPRRGQMARVIGRSPGAPSVTITVDLVPIEVRA